MFARLGGTVVRGPARRRAEDSSLGVGRPSQGYGSPVVARPNRPGPSTVAASTAPGWLRAASGKHSMTKNLT
jgi:hypothetical protein